MRGLAVHSTSLMIAYLLTLETELQQLQAIDCDQGAGFKAGSWPECVCSEKTPYLTAKADVCINGDLCKTVK